MMLEQYLNKNWEKIFETVKNGIIIIDSEGIIIKCNLSGRNIIGLGVEEVIGKHITDVIPESELHLVAKDGKARTILQKINNRMVLATRSPVFKDGKLIGAISIFQDRTDLENVLNQLDKKEKEVSNFKEIMESLYDGIVIVDEKGYITLITHNYCEFLGINMETALGKHITEVIENTRMHIVAMTGHAEIGSIQKVNGKEIVVTRLPVYREGNVTGAIGKVLFTDTSDLKTLAKRLNLMEGKLHFYKKELKNARGTKYTFKQIIGEKEGMKNAKSLALKVAKSDSTVLILGESGTGKELFAHAIHEASNRSEGPFVRVNSAAIPPELMEAELFGYAEGAFTGAKKGGKPGKIELAQGGTLFLDEIGDMPISMQVKLLRTLQEKEIERVGGTEINQVDIRVIAATNRPLKEMMNEGKFREDLYYRLNVFQVKIPPLRDRGQDILTTAHFLLGKLNNEFGKSVSKFNLEVEKLFMSYEWPGNVRELQNVIERSIHLADGSEITLDHLPPYLLEISMDIQDSSNFTLANEIERAETRAIKRALKITEGNIIKAAKLLGIHRASLYRKIEKYRIN